MLTAAGCGRDPELAKREYVQSGDAYVATSKLREAVVEYRNAVQQDPRFGEARLKLANVYAQLGEPASALREYVRAADLLPHNSDVQLRAGTALLLASQFRDAQSRAELVLQREPKNTNARLLQANALAGLTRIDEAVTEVETAIKNDPGASSTYSSLGSLQFRRGDRAAAENAYRHALELDPRSIEAHLALANFYWAERRLADAEQELKAVLQISPADAMANRALASLYLSSNRAVEAEAPLTAVAKAGAAAGQLLLVDYYILMRRSAEARTILDRLTGSSDPEAFAGAKLRIAALLEGEGKFSDALRQVDEVLAKQSVNVEALGMRASLLIATDRFDDALTAARSAQQASPGAPFTHFVLGRVLRARGESRNAITAFNQALQLNPRYTDAAIELGQMQLAEGNATEAVQLARTALDQRPNSAAARLLSARVDLATGDQVSAERTLNVLSGEYPRASSVLMEIGRLQLQQKNVPAARATFDRVLSLRSDHLPALTELTALDLSAQRGQAAITRLEAATRQHPSNGGVWILLGRVYTAQKQFDKAEATLLRGMSADASLAEVHGWLGQVYEKQGRVDEAVQAYQKLAERSPTLPAPYLYMASLYQTQNKRAEAKEAYRRALAVQPQSAIAAVNLASLYAQDNERLDEALQLAQLALARMSGSALTADTLGIIYYQKGLLTQAISAFKEAAGREPQNTAFQYHLGLAYSKAGEYRLARHLLEAALERDPDSPEAVEARATLAQLTRIGS